MLNWSKIKPQLMQHHKSRVALSDNATVPSVNAPTRAHVSKTHT